MKDQIGNKLAVGDRVLVHLPEPSIIGFISEAKETSVVAQLRGAGVSTAPGRILVACVVAFPVDSDVDAVAHVVKVHDPAQDEAVRLKAASEPFNGTSDLPRAN